MACWRGRCVFVGATAMAHLIRHRRDSSLGSRRWHGTRLKATTQRRGRAVAVDQRNDASRIRRPALTQQIFVHDGEAAALRQPDSQYIGRFIGFHVRKRLKVQQRVVAPLVPDLDLARDLCRNQIVAARNHDLHAIDATPARRRGDVGRTPLDSVITAASLPGNDFVNSDRFLHRPTRSGSFYRPVNPTNTTSGKLLCSVRRHNPSNR